MPIPFLPCSVTNLVFDNFVIDMNSLSGKLDTNGELRLLVDFFLVKRERKLDLPTHFLFLVDVAHLHI